jgi:hypothetical protein
MVMARKKEKKEKDIIDFHELTQDEVVGQGGLIKQLTGRILQKALEAEMTEHLGYEKNSNTGDNTSTNKIGGWVGPGLGLHFCCSADLRSA